MALTKSVRISFGEPPYPQKKIQKKKKKHWIGWNKITKPKKEGGLGFQTAKGKNTALLAKLN